MRNTSPARQPFGHQQPLCVPPLPTRSRDWRLPGWTELTHIRSKSSIAAEIIVARGIGEVIGDLMLSASDLESRGLGGEVFGVFPGQADDVDFLRVLASSPPARSRAWPARLSRPAIPSKEGRLT